MFRNGINYLVPIKSYLEELVCLHYPFFVLRLFFTNNRYNPEAQLDLKDLFFALSNSINSMFF